MPPAPTKRLVLTSVNQLLATIRNNPALTQKIPKFANLLAAPMSTAPKKSCNCGAKQNFTTPDVNKQNAENILSSLSGDDFQEIKSVLNLDQLCYYTRDGSKLNLVCI